MPIIDWKKQYVVGVQRIDLHHRYLFSLLNSTYENLVQCTPTEDLSLFLNEFTDFLIYHFSVEEELMREKQYPGQQTHKKQHDRCIERITMMQKEYLEGSQSLLIEIVCYLANWLSSHIPASDAELALFIAESQGGELRDIEKKTPAFDCLFKNLI